MNGRPGEIMRRALVIVWAAIAADAAATIQLPPTLEEVVAGADHIGLVEVLRAEVYRPTDAEGELQCGILIEGSWIGSLSGGLGRVEFVSRHPLDVDTVSSCTRSRGLPRTVFRSTKFLNEQDITAMYRTETWVEDPGFLQPPFDVVTIFPSELTIGDETLTRERFLEAFYDEGRHQVVRAAGWSLVVFRAVDWQQYCRHLVELSAGKQLTLPDTSFCALRTWTEVARW